MSGFALVLVLSSALAHATWNLLAKRSGGGVLFVWLFTTLSSLFLVPTATVLLVVRPQAMTPLGGVFLVGTALLHLLYFITLQRAYRSGDLSLVYPIARGLGPALATALAIALLGERPSAAVLLGLVFVVLGVVLLTMRRPLDRDERSTTAVLYGMATGTLIGIYTVWDKYAVSQLNVPPLVLEAFAGCGIAAILAPRAARRWPEVISVWREQRTEVVGVAVLAPTSYILVLTAMSFTQVSYVAPAREISILFAAALGTQLLREGNTVRRMTAACLIVGGVAVLAVA